VSGALSRVGGGDGERTVARGERAAASGLELDWPQRMTIKQLALVRPWLLVERDPQGGLPLRALFAPSASVPGAAPAADASTGSEPFAVSIAQLVTDDGGIRIVDRAISPAFAVDLQSAALQGAGFSTAP